MKLPLNSKGNHGSRMHARRQSRLGKSHKGFSSDTEQLKTSQFLRSLKKSNDLSVWAMQDLQYYQFLKQLPHIALSILLKYLNSVHLSVNIPPGEFLRY